MDTDKFRSIALRIEAYKKLRELADNCFPMPLSMAMTTTYIINKAYDTWLKSDKVQSDYNPYPYLKL
jgi:hypothetical protein